MTLTEILIYFTIGFSGLIFIIGLILYISYKINSKESFQTEIKNKYPINQSFRRNNSDQINSRITNTSPNRNYINNQPNYSIPAHDKYFIYHNKLSE